MLKFIRSLALEPNCRKWHLVFFSVDDRQATGSLFNPQNLCVRRHVCAKTSKIPGLWLRRVCAILAVQMLSITALAQTYQYDASGRITKVTYPNGSSTAYTYDATGNQLSINSNGGSTSIAAPVITISASPNGTLGSSFNYTIAASNSPTSYSVAGSLPPGLSLNTSTGVISGTPTAAGTFTVTIGASNAGGTSTSSPTFTISASTPTATQGYSPTYSPPFTGHDLFWFGSQRIGQR